MDTVEGTAELSKAGNPLAVAGPFGQIERFASGQLQGWCVSPHQPGEPVDIIILIDGRELSRCETSESRDDLAKAGLHGGSAGFSIRLPVSPTGNPDYRIDAVFTKTGEAIADGPVSAMNQPVSLIDALGGGVAQAALASPAPITIIVPIFNAYDEVKSCLSSLIRQTTWPCGLILIDDASTDGRIAKLLDTIKGYPGVTVCRNPENLGFTRTVNLGIAMAGGCDVVLLNSDTVVTPRWLENLRVAAYAQADVGTVTPLSNNAGAFSVPERNVVNVLPSWLSADRYARAVSQSSAGLYPEAPTGNGFCLYIRRAMLDDVGALHETAFPRGYGEENDLCMRALRRGWRHVIDDRTIIYHVRSASFGAEKDALYRDGRQVIDRRYPEYGALVRQFGASPELAVVRYRVRRIDDAPPAGEGLPRPRAMFVISTDTGGTPQTNMDLMRALAVEYDTLLLRCDSGNLSVSRIVNGRLVRLEEHALARPLEPVSHRTQEYDHIVACWLVRYAVELLHIRHIGWHSLTLPRIARGLGIPIVFSFHDFYTACPTIKLLDDKSAFCGGTCTEGKGTCTPELWPRTAIPHLKHEWVHAWRDRMSSMLRECDAFVTTTPSARDILIRNFPWLAERDLRLIPHGRDFTEFRALAPPLQVGERLRVLVPGNIGPAKGADLIADIKRLDIHDMIEFHFLGNVSAKLAQQGTHHGPYEREEFPGKLATIRPHIGAVLSIWPETYSHTLTEMWACGLPVVGIDLGAIGDRLREFKGGWLVASSDPALVLSRLLEIAADAEGHWQAVSEVRVWQQGHGRSYGTAAMADRYSDLYREIMGRRRVFIPATRTGPVPKVIGLLSVGKPARYPPDGLRWLLDWLRYPDADTFRTRAVTIGEIADGDSAVHLDALVLGDEKVPPAVAAAIDRFLIGRRIPLVLSRDGCPMVRRHVTDKTTSVPPWAEVPLAADAALRYAVDETLWLRPVEPAPDLGDSSPVMHRARKTVVLAPDWDSADSMRMFELLRAELAAHADVTLLAFGDVGTSSGAGIGILPYPDQPKDFDKFKLAVRGIAEGWCLAVYLPASDTGSADRLARRLVGLSLLGIPPLAPKLPPFSALIQDGATGFLTGASSDDLLGRVRAILSESADMAAIRNSAQVLIKERLTFRKQMQSFRNFLSRTLGL
jgi:GT2 family glycosyltransferase/glycosyltransferase involved in cell wall biosynthesis